MNEKKFKLHPFSIKFILACLIFSLTLFVYWDVQYHQFLNFDDSVYVKSNYNVKNGFSLENIKWAFGFTDVAYWHPLTWISHMLDSQLFGIEPGPHHMMNLAIHILNSLLLFLILLKMTGAQFKAALVALLFAVHPLQVESVAWVAERKTVLSALLFMAAIYSYTFYIEKKKRWMYVAALFLFTLGLLSKPIILILPFLLLFLDYWPLKRFRRLDSLNDKNSVTFINSARKFIFLYKSDAGPLIREKIPFFILSLMSLAISMASVLKGGIVVNYQVIPIYLRIENLFISIIQYLRNIILPVELSIFYPFPRHIPAWYFLLALVAVALATFIAIKMRKSRPWLITGWAWFLIALLPAGGLVQAGLWPAIANRFMYLPMIGFFIIVIWEGGEIIKGRYSRVLKIILCIVMLIYFSSLTRVQNLYFSNSYALFKRCLAVAGDNDIAFNNIGDALASLGRVDEAMEYFAKSINISPTNNARAYSNYGIALVMKGDDLNAIPYFSQAVNLNPNLVESYLNLGLIEFRRGNVDGAVELLSKALEIDQTNLSTRHNLGAILASQGKFEEAIDHFFTVLRRDPTYLPARLSLSQAYEENKLYDKALTEYEILNKMTPKNKAYIYYRIAGVYSKQKKFKECVDYLETALNNHGFNVLENLKADKNFQKFRETTLYSQFLEKQEIKRH